MNELRNRNNTSSASYKLWKLAVIFALVLAVFFRFANLDDKVYSADEVRKILWLSGYSSEEFIQTNFSGNKISAAELKEYQRPGPNRNLLDALSVLSNKSEHVPLHHILTRYWMFLFPEHPSAKVISVIISFLSFPALYWLCLELFNSSLAGLIFVLLAAVNPYSVLVAQNSGSYSLWLSLIWISSASLLRALRLDKKSAWFLYSTVLTLGFYTHFFSVVLVLGQGIYVFINERLRFKKIKNYFASTAFSLFLFSPWLFATVTNLDRVDEAGSYYSQFNVGINDFFAAYFKSIGSFFIDFYHNKGKTENALHIALLAVIVYSFYFLIAKTPLRVWSFVLIMAIVTPLLHGIANFLSPSAVHIQSRYFLPSFLAIQLSLSFLLTTQINSRLISIWQRRLWQSVFISIIVLGVISNGILSASATAAIDDQKGTASGQNVELSSYINASPKPLVVSDASHSFILALLYHVKDDVTFRLFNRKEEEKWAQLLNLKADVKDFSDIFLLYPSQQLLEAAGEQLTDGQSINSIKTYFYQWGV